MSGLVDDFIELDRTFRDVTISDEEGDEVKMVALFTREAPTRWAELLAEPRVILLAEAGSGKTEEIRHACRRQRADDEWAFFLRLENVVDCFETCFEEGDIEEFENWLASGERGWLFLDSVDEARLRNPKDFEIAIRCIGKRIKCVLPRSHVVIAGRPEAWRPNTDRRLCRDYLPLDVRTEETAEVAARRGTDAVVSVHRSRREDKGEPFRIVTLEDLHGPQVGTFARAKGVFDLKAFKTAVDRAGALSLTTRPLDLAEIVEFWNKNGRIGSLHDIMTTSIAKRLEERDQDRADARPIAVDRIRKGVRLVAAATLLCKESAVRVPDGDQNARGLPIRDVLTEWNDRDRATLLSRPIFVPGVYGTVRFHHRSVREYLTAEWLQSLLIDDGSRRKIEGLFFRKHYGIEVVVPTMRPVLPWLAALDERIRIRVVDLAPEVLFEGGDPSMLPLDTQRRTLRNACKQLAQPVHGRSVLEFDAVRRFANTDLTDEISVLLDQYSSIGRVTDFLLRLIAQGGIATLADRAKHFALTSRSRSTRIEAIRAVFAIGNPRHEEEIRREFLGERTGLSRDLLGELLVKLPSTDEAVDWLLQALEAAAPMDPNQVDRLSYALAQCVSELSVACLGAFMDGLIRLLQREPLMVGGYCRVSDHHGWLAPTVARVAVRLIEARDPEALSPSTLTALWLLPIACYYDPHGLRDMPRNLPDLVREWPQLNYDLFWHSVAQEREWYECEEGKRLDDYWRISVVGSYWGFDPTSFDVIANEIATRPLLDDRLVALTLAFRLSQEGNRRKELRDRLRLLVAGDETLSAKLQSLLHPPVGEDAECRRQEALPRRRDARSATAQRMRVERHKSLLAARIDQIRDPGKPGVYTCDQHYLLQQMRSARGERSNHLTDGNWSLLIETYGEPVASAFRDAAVRFWREYQPRTRSQGAATSSIPWEVIFGLTGIAIEAREVGGWLGKLSQVEAERAARYALSELNGFPTWLPDLHGAFPNEVAGVLLEEIRHELAVESPDRETHYVLYDMVWHGGFARDQIAPELLPALRAERINVTNLGHLLAIVQGSSVPDAEIAEIAARKASAKCDPSFSPTWYATWVGVDPGAGIPAIADRLAELADPVEQTALAQRFVVALLGARWGESRARLAYRTVQHMKTLYLLMAKYIREEDDTERCGSGAYSPELRDDAQDARDALFAFIRETPGKEAYLALKEMEWAHPTARAQARMGFHAKAKATLDADLDAWQPSAVKEFNDERVATPTNHRDLWRLGVERLEDLKHDLEHGDESIASVLQRTNTETEFRIFVGGWLRDRAGNRYSVPQEEQLADARRPDLRLHGAGVDAPVPIELKVADNWTGPQLLERMEFQLVSDYLRDRRSTCGIFLLVYLGEKKGWDISGSKPVVDFEALLLALRQHWSDVSARNPSVEDLAVVGIDLTRRGRNARVAGV